MREKVIEAIESEKMIVIVRGLSDDKIIPFAEAVYEGGIRLMEITYNASNPTEDIVTANNIKRLVEHFGDKMMIGAGTVLTEKQVELTKEAGGKFIISPDSDPDIIKKTRELGLVSIPGALTPTEIKQAHKAGADFIKLFPVNTMGADYVKAVKAPLSQVKLLAVGGVKPENFGAYMKAGICGFGIGSFIVDKNLIEAGKFTEITKRAREYREAAQNI